MQEWIQMKINWNIYKKGGTAHKGSYVQVCLKQKECIDNI